MKINYNNVLYLEQEKLNKLVDEALKNGTPITETHEIMEQCRKINEMMLENEETQ